jgi:hypothetical protein
VAQALTELERAALLIVLETPRRSDKSTSYVRRKLIAELEQALRKSGINVDAGLRRMREYKRKQKAERDRVIAEYNARPPETEAEKTARRATYQAAMAQRLKGDQR